MHEFNVFSLQDEEKYLYFCFLNYPIRNLDKDTCNLSINIFQSLSVKMRGCRTPVCRTYRFGQCDISINKIGRVRLIVICPHFTRFFTSFNFDAI